MSECLTKAKTEVIEVHISCHFGLVLPTVDSVIIRLLLSLAFMLALLVAESHWVRQTFKTLLFISPLFWFWFIHSYTNCKKLFFAALFSC